MHAGNPPTAELLPTTLVDKLLQVMWYLDGQNSGRSNGKDQLGLKSLIDDPEVAGWLDKMNKAGRIHSTRFVLGRNY